MYPKIYLSIDTCFASKRWTEPNEWMRVIRGLGLQYVEASADTECDPLYTTPQYRQDWIKKVRLASENTGVQVSQMYSGHGTYTTLGLGHTDERIRRHMMEGWLRVMCEQAGSLGACIGFFCHAFPHSVLQEPESYADMLQKLYRQLAQVAGWAQKSGCDSAGVEVMYSPHQVPWTLSGAESLLKEVNSISDSPFYLSLDVGHQVGQSRFLKPTAPELLQTLETLRESPDNNLPWLGPDKVYELYREALKNLTHEDDITKIYNLMDRHPYLFAKVEDGVTENWLEQFGCYSPIIHLQQTDGTASKHLPFTPECNAYGIVNGGLVLNALLRSFERPALVGMPPKAQKIYLTLEIFSGTADRADDILSRLEQSVAYWRQFIPRDGMALNELTDGKTNE